MSQLATDRLDGASEIATFFFGSASSENRRKVFRLIDQKAIPAGKLGGRLVASKRALAAHYRMLTGAQAAEW
jgi:hypothetical protein